MNRNPDDRLPADADETRREDGLSTDEARRRGDLSTDGGSDGPADDPAVGSSQEWGPDPLRTWQTGERTPAPPTAAGTARLLAATGGLDGESPITCIRVLLVDGDQDTRTAFLEGVAAEPSVVATSAPTGAGPDREDAVDLLLAPEHDSLVSSSAIAKLDGVAGVSFAMYSADSEVTAAVERARRDDRAGGAGDDGRPDDETRDRRATAPADGAGTDRAADSVQAEFEALKSEVGAVDYETLVEELDDAAVEPADSVRVDIEPLLEPAEAESSLTDGSTETTGAISASDSSTDLPGSDGLAAFDGDAGDAAGRPDDASDGAMLVGDPQPAGDDSPDLNPEAVLDALVTALDERTLRERELAAFRDALGVSRPESLRARVDHLATRVNEVLAYSEALSSFIDETDGGGRVADVETEVASLADRLDAAERRIESVESATDAETEHLAALAEAVERHDARLEELASDRAATDAELADRLEDVDRRLATLEDELESLRAWRAHLTESLAGDDAGNGE